ncbi:MAG: hypothetical protein OXU88_08615 [Gammaproteobacteria bacterium]|nr:hypothetical protein [Gammaproteobacteria bacterium]
MRQFAHSREKFAAISKHKFNQFTDIGKRPAGNALAKRRSDRMPDNVRMNALHVRRLRRFIRARLRDRKVSAGKLPSKHRLPDAAPNLILSAHGFKRATHQTVRTLPQYFGIKNQGVAAAMQPCARPFHGIVNQRPGDGIAGQYSTQQTRQLANKTTPRTICRQRQQTNRLLQVRVVAAIVIVVGGDAVARGVCDGLRRETPLVGRLAEARAEMEQVNQLRTHAQRARQRRRAVDGADRDIAPRSQAQYFADIIRVERAQFAALHGQTMQMHIAVQNPINRGAIPMTNFGRRILQRHTVDRNGAHFPSNIRNVHLAQNRINRRFVDAMNAHPHVSP